MFRTAIMQIYICTSMLAVYQTICGSSCKNTPIVVASDIHKTAKMRKSFLDLVSYRTYLSVVHGSFNRTIRIFFSFCLLYILFRFPFPFHSSSSPYAVVVAAPLLPRNFPFCFNVSNLCFHRSIYCLPRVLK